MIAQHFKLTRIFKKNWKYIPKNIVIEAMSIYQAACIIKKLVDTLEDLISDYHMNEVEAMFLVINK
ncbi:hypothetical protein RhiirA4_492691 [Rhizophagus irregularis]|uniref:Uncharacterized protein n=1 Tax=Rhizophagus irregularis TaxID=588596 RepID=A0A2I1HXC9_9GLOM|nr:hypothetical protein RhiirA4_492691 [Rhizophagus irregularis]